MSNKEKILRRLEEIANAPRFIVLTETATAAHLILDVSKIEVFLFPVVKGEDIITRIYVTFRELPFEVNETPSEIIAQMAGEEINTESTESTESTERSTE